MINYREMTDKELFEFYSALKTQLHLINYETDKKLIGSYLSCTSEIAMRYFDEHRIIDRRARDELISNIC